nr:hypothetical protein [Granulosicoccus sp.]
MKQQIVIFPAFIGVQRFRFRDWLSSVILVVSLLAAPQLFAQPVIVDDMISWPDDGWYEVQTASDFRTLCEGGTECQVERGLYNVINHSTGDRWDRLSVGPVVNGNSISWRGSDWYQVQHSDTLETHCEGRDPCAVESGVYIVINLSTGKRWPNIEVVADGAEDSQISAEVESASGKTLVLNLVGTGAMYIDTVPAAEGLGAVVEAWCFDVDLVDMKTGDTVGTATDCLDPSLNTTKLSESGLGMIGTTYFNLPDGLLAIQG